MQDNSTWLMILDNFDDEALTLASWIGPSKVTINLVQQSKLNSKTLFLF